VGAATQVSERNITNPVWTISGSGVIKSYIAPNTSAPTVISNLAAADLDDQSSVVFYDWLPEQVTATCSGTYQGVPVSANVQITFVAPSFTSPSLTWIPESGYVQEDTSITGYDGWELGPDMSTPYQVQYGMNYQPPNNILHPLGPTYLPQMPPGFDPTDGSFNFLQVATPNRQILADKYVTSTNSFQQQNLVTDPNNTLSGLDVQWPPVTNGDTPVPDISGALRANCHRPSKRHFLRY
jgi:hypothetical protein